MPPFLRSGVARLRLAPLVAHLRFVPVVRVCPPSSRASLAHARIKTHSHPFSITRHSFLESWRATLYPPDCASSRHFWLKILWLSRSFGCKVPRLFEFAAKLHSQFLRIVSIIFDHPPHRKVKSFTTAVLINLRNYSNSCNFPIYMQSYKIYVIN